MQKHIENNEKRPTTTIYGTWICDELQCYGYKHPNKHNLTIFALKDDNHIKMVGVKTDSLHSSKYNYIGGKSTKIKKITKNEFDKFILNEKIVGKEWDSDECMIKKNSYWYLSKY